ncbi:Mce-associated membrane protein [Krasilnikovia cinnamomea]|uniref:Mce-associated membrane protein n=1 Tax=Krasilnikovia cinnamomea TaxID=349313 RepID=A0A4Q7ZEK0_9ACTN|nr:RDD family protein [Krasilnikovia cinnamomea]RZU49098.1 Mce-associated membrane protein [Krasilnikovia cinnamomea]
MNYASWLRRAGGYLVDVVLAFLPSFAGGLVYESTVGPDGQPSALGRTADLIGIALAVVVFAYNRWIRAGRTGRTWGRQLMRINLIGEQDGGPVGGGRALLRDLGHIVDTLALCLGWLAPLWDGKRQTFSDKMVGTVVVEAV